MLLEYVETPESPKVSMRKTSQLKALIRKPQSCAVWLFDVSGFLNLLIKNQKIIGKHNVIMFKQP